MLACRGRWIVPQERAGGTGCRSYRARIRAVNASTVLFRVGALPYAPTYWQAKIECTTLRSRILPVVYSENSRDPRVRLETAGCYALGLRRHRGAGVRGLQALQPADAVLPGGGREGAVLECGVEGVWAMGREGGRMKFRDIYVWDGEMMRQRTRWERLCKRFTHGLGCIGLAWSIWRKPWQTPESDDPFDNIALSTAIVVAWGIWK